MTHRKGEQSEDLRELQRSNERLRQRHRMLQERNRSLRGLRRTVEMLSVDADVDDLLVTLLAEIRAHLGAVACSVWLVEGRELVCRRAEGRGQDGVEGRRLALGEGVVGRAVERGESVRVADASVDDRFDHLDAQVNRFEARSMLAVPLLTASGAIGAMQVLAVGVDRFGDRAVAMLENVAAHAAVAIENALLTRRRSHHATALRGLQTGSVGIDELLGGLVSASDDIIFAVEMREERYTLMHVPPRYGLAGRDLIGKRPHDVVPAPLADMFSSHIRCVAESNRPQVFEEDLTWRGGRLVMTTALAPIRDPAGQVVSVLGIGRDISAWKEAARGLTASRDRLRALFMESPLGIVTLDRQGCVEGINPAAMEILGVEAGESLSEVDLLEHVRLDDEQRERLKQGETLHLAISFDRGSRQPAIRPASESAEVVHLDWLIAPLEPAGYLAVIEDVTDERAMEQALRQSEERFRTYLDEAPLGVCVCDEAGVLLSANRAALQIFGAGSFAEISHVRFLEHDGLGEAEWERLAAGEPVRLESVIDFDLMLAEDGFQPSRTGIAHVEWLMAALPPSGYLIQVEEATERHEALRALAASEERYRRLVELAPELIGVQRGFELIYLNPAGARLLGVDDPQTLIGCSTLDFLPPENRARVTERMQKLMAAPNTAVGPVEEEIVLPNGDRIDVLFAVASITYEGAPATQVILWDISERKRAERLLERTERLAALGELTTLLAHEIGNPLQAMRTTLDYLQRFQPTGSEQIHCLNVLHDEVRRLVRLTRQLQELGRPEEERAERIDASAILERVLVLLGPHLRSAAVTVNVEAAEDLPPLIAIRDQIQQVILNLVLNALQAMPSGGRIDVTLGTAPGEGGALVLEVGNDGPPIDPLVMEHMFEPFSSDGSEGHGLGLFICRTIVRRHGGTIEAENRPEGRGPLFTVTLPLDGGA